MTIGLTYDLRTEYVFKSGDPQDANAEFDHPDTVRVIQEALEALGHRVVRIGNAERLVRSWDRLEADIVFNIAEGYFGRNREAQVPILLEMKGLPFTGSDGLTQALTLDKLLTKKILVSEGIPTPRFFELAHREDPLPPDLSFPLIVKPRYEGSSKGLTEASLVRGPESLRAQADWVIRTYRQPALAEEFIRGNEFTVALIGNDSPEVFPPLRVLLAGQRELGELFYTYSRIEAARYLCPAEIDAKLDLRLRELALATYRAVECLDFGRVDFRVDEEGNPYALEINPLPSLSTEDVFGVLAQFYGLPYGAMIEKVLEAALRRYGMGEPRGVSLVHQPSSGDR